MNFFYVLVDIHSPLHDKQQQVVDGNQLPEKKKKKETKKSTDVLLMVQSFKRNAQNCSFWRIPTKLNVPLLKFVCLVIAPSFVFISFRI